MIRAGVAGCHGSQDWTKTLRTFKEMWCVDNCSAALQGQGLYEAGGSLCWLSLEVEGPAPADPVTMQGLTDLKNEMFVPISVAGREGPSQRIVFPANILAYVKEVPSTYPRNMAILGSKALVAAWWATRLMMACNCVACCGAVSAASYMCVAVACLNLTLETHPAVNLVSCQCCFTHASSFALCVR